MTALSANDRLTVEQFSTGPYPPIPLTASTKIVGGVMVMVVAGTGTALNAADTASGLLMGISTQLVDTSLGHTKCPYKRGRFWFVNDGTITAAMIGKQAEVLDNQTVTQPGGGTNHVFAGEILDLQTINGVSQVLLDMMGGKIGTIGAV